MKRSNDHETKRSHRQARGSIISLLRGAFACPMIAVLTEMGIVDRILSGPFGLKDFPSVADQHALASVFRYLHRLNLISPISEEEYSVSDNGRSILGRSGAFLLLFSYRKYFEGLSDILTAQAMATVDRRSNVIGSGALHSRKFFPTVWQMFRDAPPSALVDLGCGDGRFLCHARAEWPEIAVAGVDLSPIAVETAVRTLELEGYSKPICVVQNAASVSDWSGALPDQIRNRSPLLISMWFVVHEFSGGDSSRVISFFCDLRKIVPAAEVLIGEITLLPSTLLAENYEFSIMPEFLLFHELSGQGVLTWNCWNEILSEIPYKLAVEKLFDVIGDPSSGMPSSFIWHLKPV